MATLSPMDGPSEAGWENSFLTDISQFSTYILPVEVEPKEVITEPYVPRQFSDEEVLAFNIEQERLRSQRKAVLVLDLDHTLVHCTRKKDKELMAPSFTVGDEVWYYHLRPGLAYFLQQMQQHFELVLYTFATRSYAEYLLSVIESLFPAGQKVQFRSVITRNECIDKKRKSVTELFPEHSMVFAVDDNKGGVWYELENLIRVPPYYHFGKKAKLNLCDTHLTVLCSLLKKLHVAHFEQGLQTRSILGKLREVAFRLCPLPVQPQKISKSKKLKHILTAANNQYCAADKVISNQFINDKRADGETLQRAAEISDAAQSLKSLCLKTEMGVANEQIPLHCGEDDRRAFSAVVVDAGNSFVPTCTKVIVLSTCETLSVNVCS